MAENRILTFTSGLWNGIFSQPEADFTIISSGRNGTKISRRVHKVVVASQSEFFRGLFDHCHDLHIEIPDLKFEILEVILEYFYTRKLPRYLKVKKIELKNWADFFLATKLVNDIDLRYF